MKIGQLFAACVVSTSFGIGLSLPTPFEASYKNHVEIQQLHAQLCHQQLLDIAQRISDLILAKPNENTKRILELTRKEEEEHWIRILAHAQSNPYMAKMAAKGIASNMFNMKEDSRKWSKRLDRLHSFAVVKKNDALEWRILYSGK